MRIKKRTFLQNGVLNTHNIYNDWGTKTIDERRSAWNCYLGAFQRYYQKWYAALDQWVESRLSQKNMGNNGIRYERCPNQYTNQPPSQQGLPGLDSFRHVPQTLDQIWIWGIWRQVDALSSLSISWAMPERFLQCVRAYCPEGTGKDNGPTAIGEGRCHRGGVHVKWHPHEYQHHQGFQAEHLIVWSWLILFPSPVCGFNVEAVHVHHKAAVRISKKRSSLWLKNTSPLLHCSAEQW